MKKSIDKDKFIEFMLTGQVVWTSQEIEELFRVDLLSIEEIMKMREDVFYQELTCEEILERYRDSLTEQGKRKLIQIAGK